MQKDELEIVRAVSIKLDDDLAFVLSYQYHTEKDPDDPAGRRNDRSKSRYRMMGRVMRISAMEKAVSTLHEDANRMLPWKWPDDPSWQGRILYMKDSNNEAFSNWLRLKVKKLVPWDIGMKILAGFKKDLSLPKDKIRKLGAEAYTVFTPNAVYDTEGYTCSDGSTISITDKEALKSKAGQNVWKEIPMKMVGRGKGEEEPGETAE